MKNQSNIKSQTKQQNSEKISKKLRFDLLYGHIKPLFENKIVSYDGNSFEVTSVNLSEGIVTLTTIHLVNNFYFSKGSSIKVDFECFERNAKIISKFYVDKKTI